MTDKQTSRTEGPGTALSKSIGRSDVIAGLSTAADAGMDVGLEALHGVPILGTLVGMAKAGFSIHKELEFRKIVRFLNEVARVPPEKRTEFTEKLKSTKKMEDFGENILLLLERLDDTIKPTIVGRIMAAHIKGDLDYDRTMRLCAMVSRSYTADFSYLKTFKAGTQGEGADIAAVLSANGLLRQNGIDSGTFAEAQQGDGGYLYEMNEYGEILLRIGLSEE